MLGSNALVVSPEGVETGDPDSSFRTLAEGREGSVVQTRERFRDTAEVLDHLGEIGMVVKATAFLEKLDRFLDRPMVRERTDQVSRWNGELVLLAPWNLERDVSLADGFGEFAPLEGDDAQDVVAELPDAVAANRAPLVRRLVSERNPGVLLCDLELPTLQCVLGDSDREAG